MSKRVLLLVLCLACALSWGELALLVLTASPDDSANRVAFFVLLFVAVLLSGAMVTYWLSYRLNLYRLHRGDPALSFLQALPVASLVTTIAYLQSLRDLNLAIAMILAVIAGLAEYILLPKAAGRDYVRRSLCRLPRTVTTAARQQARALAKGRRYKLEPPADKSGGKIIDLAKVRARKKDQTRDSGWKSKN